MSIYFFPKKVKIYRKERIFIMIEKYLEDLEKRIKPDVEDALLGEWKDFCDGRFKGDIFKPKRKEASPSAIKWPEIPINDALEDYEKMALRELKLFCSDAISNTGNSALMNVRCNYGTGIMSSLFGCELFLMEREQDTLPTTIPLRGGGDSIRALLDGGMPDINTALGGKVFEMGEYFKKLLRDYPGISKYVSLYHPDLQGPLDICELVWGSELFVEFFDNARLVHEFLELITETYIAFMKKWTGIAAFDSDYSVHWSTMLKGNIMLRDDSAMNLSPVMFEEFVMPYDSRLLERFGGGCIHFCGRGDHYIDKMSAIPDLFAINMSQPHLNDMEKIFQNTVDKGIKIISFPAGSARKYLSGGRSFCSNLHESE